MAKKWLKLKQSRKPHICDIRGLRVKNIITDRLNLGGLQVVDGISAKITTESTKKYIPMRLIKL